VKNIASDVIDIDDNVRREMGLMEN